MKYVLISFSFFSPLTLVKTLPALVHHHDCLNYAVCVLTQSWTLCTFDLTSFIWDSMILAVLFIYCCHSKWFFPLPARFSGFVIQMELWPKANLSSCLIWPVERKYISNEDSLNYTCNCLFLSTCGLKKKKKVVNDFRLCGDSILFIHEADEWLKMLCLFWHDVALVCFVKRFLIEVLPITIWR